MREKVELAAIIGTLQSTLTTFRYIGKQWMEATVDERLLGVSLTGIYDNAILGDPDPSLRLVLGDLRDAAIRVNKEYAHKLGIEQSRAITCVKPSGTVSQLCNSSSGIHPRFSEYYIRRVRMSDSDPLTKYMEGNGFKCETDFYNDSARVFSFPIASPTGCVTRKDVSALDQLKLWKMYQDRWCEHKPSVTIQVREDEWMDVGAWVYTNFNEVSGVSFLPYDSGTYRQPPYEEITKDEYNKLIKETPKDVCWTAFKEDLDSTTGSQELACVSGSCEL
jgi:ribonucleoside-diphosphate reductase alpha chain